MLIYKQILKARARRWRTAPGASVPTVCVGNVTVGGTGKTPHTELILSLLQESDRWGASRAAMLSRGYKRRSKGFQIVSRDSTAAFAGDEPLQIARKFPAVTVAVDKDRVQGCARLSGRQAATLGPTNDSGRGRVSRTVCPSPDSMAKKNSGDARGRQQPSPPLPPRAEPAQKTSGDARGRKQPSPPLPPHAEPAQNNSGDGSAAMPAPGAAEFSAADIIVLDDAFQFNRLHASLNIVLVDWSRPVFEDSLLPFGRLRDLPQRIFEADIIIVSKCPPGIDNWDKTSFAGKLRLKDYSAQDCSAVTPLGKRITLLFSHMEYCQLKPVFPEADARYCYSKSAVLFSGIANDRPLRAHVSDIYRISGAIKFPDHHAFSKSDIARIADLVRKNPTAALLTTEKDAVRLLDYAPTSHGEKAEGSAMRKRSRRTVPAEIRERLFAVPIRAAFSDERELETLRRRLETL